MLHVGRVCRNCLRHLQAESIVGVGVSACLLLGITAYLRGLTHTQTNTIVTMASDMKVEKVTFPSQHSAGEGQGVMFGDPAVTPKVGCTGTPN